MGQSLDFVCSRAAAGFGDADSLTTARSWLWARQKSAAGCSRVRLLVLETNCLLCISMCSVCQIGGRRLAVVIHKVVIKLIRSTGIGRRFAIIGDDIEPSGNQAEHRGYTYKERDA